MSSGQGVISLWQMYGVEGFWTRGDKSQIDTTGLEHQVRVGPNVWFCFL